MHQQLWGYKVEDKLYAGVREQKRLNITGLVGTGDLPMPAMWCGPRWKQVPMVVMSA
jgi:hypothetical protein